MRLGSKMFPTKKGFLLTLPLETSHKASFVPASSFTTYAPVLKALQTNFSSKKQPMRHYNNRATVETTAEPNQEQYKQIAAEIDDNLFLYLKHHNETYQYLSDRLSCVEVRNHTLQILNINAKWSLFVNINQDTAKIIEDRVDAKLGSLAQQIMGFAWRMARYEKEEIEIAILRQRILAEKISEVTDEWEKRLLEISHNLLLTDNEIVALFNINSILRKYFIQLHEKKPLLTNEWSLIFQEPPLTWELDDMAIQEIEKIKGLDDSLETELAKGSKKITHQSTALKEHPKKGSEERNVYDPSNPYSSFYKLPWKNATSHLPIGTNIRKYSMNERWQVIIWDADTFHTVIVRKVDPELGDIAKLLVAKVKHLADLESKGEFSSVLNDKIFHDEMTNLNSQWNLRLKTLYKDGVIREHKIQGATTDEYVSIYNINLMIEKYYGGLHKLMEPEINTESSPYLMP